MKEFKCAAMKVLAKEKELEWNDRDMIITLFGMLENTKVQQDTLATLIELEKLTWGPDKDINNLAGEEKGRIDAYINIHNSIGIELDKIFEDFSLFNIVLE